MLSKSSVSIKFLAMTLLSSISCMVQADFQNCTVSGGPGVIESTGGPTSGVPWQLQYDPDQKKARILQGEGSPICVTDVTQYADTLRLDGCNLVFSRQNGNPFYNHAEFSNGLSAGSGSLVDRNGDGLADALAILVSAYSGRTQVPMVLTDIPLQYYPASGTPTHWLLPQNLSYGPVTLRNPNYYTPINAQKQSLDIECPGLTVSTGLRASSSSFSSSIPTASFWGYAAMILLLMFTGIGVLRSRGFGNEFDLRG